jgi:uncharacterized membrane protein
MIVYCWTGQDWYTMIGAGMWIWPLVLAGLGYLAWYSFRPRRRRYIREEPVEVIRMRLARGEITVEEFESIRKAVTP